MRLTPIARMAAVSLALVGESRAQAVTPDERGFAVPRPVARTLSAEYRTVDDRRAKLESELLGLPGSPRNERSTRVGWKMFGYGETMPLRQWVEIDLQGLHPLDAVVLIPAAPPTVEANEQGIGFPRRFRVDLEDEAGARTLIGNFTGSDFPHPGILPVFIPAHGTVARRVQITLTKPWSRNLYRSYAFGEIMVLKGNRNLATGLRGVTVRTSGSVENPPAWSRRNLVDGQSAVGAPLVKSDKPLAHGWESARFSGTSATTWVQVDLGRIQPFDEVRLVPVRNADYTEGQGFGFPKRFQLHVSNTASFADSRVLIDWTATSVGDPAFAPVTIAADGLPARYFRVTSRELWQRNQDAFTFALAELQVYQGDNNVARGAAASAESSFSGPSPNFNIAYVTDGLRGMSQFVEWPDWLRQLSRRREILLEIEVSGARLAAMQPAILRTAGWTLGAALALIIAVTSLGFYRARRAQARAVVTLQRQIAGDLHDEIGSNLASIAILTELGHQQKSGLPADDAEEIGRLATESAAAMRDLVWLIQPGPHDATQLVERLRSACRRLMNGHECEFQIIGLDTAPRLDVQRHLLLALKEMLHNVLRHAKARHVAIRLNVDGGRFTLEVSDDGCGFDASMQGDGHGFTSLRHRARTLCGDLALESKPGTGTRVALHGCLHPIRVPQESSA